MRSNTVAVEVYKIGGATSSDAQHIRCAAQIVAARVVQEGKRVILVVSATEGTTRNLRGMLLTGTRECSEQDRVFPDWYGKRHTKIIQELSLSGDLDEDLLRTLECQSWEIERKVDSASDLPRLTPEFADQVLPFGELLCAELYAAVFSDLGLPCVIADPMKLVHTDRRFGRANLDHADTEHSIRAFLDLPSTPGPSVVIFPGFTGGTTIRRRRFRTTFGRNGTDYIAAEIARIVKTPALRILKEVPAVMTADRRYVPNAAPLQRVDYQEMIAAGIHGAEVVDPRAVMVCQKAGIAIEIWDGGVVEKEEPGTIIRQYAPEQLSGLVRIIAHTNHVVAVSIRGAGMHGVEGTRERIAGAFRRAHVNIIMDGQAPSENCISTIVADEDGEISKAELKKEFRHEIKSGEIDDIDLEGGIAIFAAVGATMRGKPGTLGRLFSAVGRIGVDIKMAVQTMNQANPSFIVEDTAASQALQAIHDEFEMHTLR